MAESERLGAKFSIDTSDLKAGLAQANRLIRESKSEFKAAAAGMDDWRKSEEGLIAKKKELTSTLDMQEAVLEAYKKQLEEAGYAEDDMSAAAVTLRTKINNQQADVNKTKKELEKMDNALADLEGSSDDAGDAMEDLGDSAKDAGDGFTIAKGAIANLVSKGIETFVGAAKNAISSLLNLSDETREYREDIGKLNTAFEAAGKSTDLAKKTYKEFYKVLGEEDRSVEAVNHLAKFVDTEKDMQKWTDICAGVWGTFGDSLPIEGLTEASNETAKVGKITGVLADALNWAGVNEDDFQASLDKCSNEQERSKLITETLNGLYGEAAEKYKENNKSVMESRDATSDLTDAQAELGAKIEPLITKFTELKTKGLLWFVDKGIPFVRDNLPMIGTLLGGLTTAIIAQTIATKMKTIADGGQLTVTGLLTAAQEKLNLAMKANVIGIVITAITALVAAFTYLWKNCEGFRNFWIGLWNKIKSVASTAWNAIKKVFSSVGGFFKDKFLSAYNAVKNVFTALPTFFSNLWGKIKNTFSSLGTKIGDAIGGAVKAGINGVIGWIEKTVNKAVRLINGAIDLINKIPAVNIGHVSELNLPRLAKGGVVKHATRAVLGEDGAEAVVPLERNTEWIDKVADKVSDKIASKGGGVVVNQTNNYSQAHSRYEIYKSKQQTAAAVRLALGRA